MDEAAVLAKCKRGEDVARKAYEDALRKDLPVDVRSMVGRQYQGVRQHQDRVRQLRGGFVIEFGGSNRLRQRIQRTRSLHNLQIPENRREILADEKLRKVFGNDKVSMFEMNKYLAAHLK